jgi:hypothetical protein
MNAQVTREDITPQQVADWKDSSTPYLLVAAALVGQIRDGTLRGEVPATPDLVKEHHCRRGDVVTAKILLAQLGFLRTDRRGFHLPEDVTWATAAEDITDAGTPGDVTVRHAQRDSANRAALP